MSAKTRMWQGLGTVLAAVLTAGGLAIGAGTAASAQTTPTATAAAKDTLTAPSNLHVTSETFTDLNLAWDASTSSTGSGVFYELFVDGKIYSFPDTPSADVRLGAGYGLTPGTTHTFQVEAWEGDPSNGVNTGKNGVLGNKLTVTLGPGDTTAPTAPANLHVVSSSTSGVVLGWDASTDANSPDITYFVYNPCGIETTGTEAGIPSESANPVCGIPAGSTITIRIFARDPSNNQSPQSNPVTFTMP